MIGYLTISVLPLVKTVRCKITIISPIFEELQLDIAPVWIISRPYDFIAGISHNAANLLHRFLLTNWFDGGRNLSYCRNISEAGLVINDQVAIDNT